MQDIILKMKIVIWKEEQQFLFDYRSDPCDDSQFRYIQISLQLPRKERKYYYLIHQTKVNSKTDKQILVERRKNLFSSPSPQIIQQNNTNNAYRLMCAFEIEHDLKGKFYIKGIAASKIDRKGNEAICKVAPCLIIRTVEKWPLKLHQQIRFGKLKFNIDELVITKSDSIEMNCDESDVLNLDELVQESKINSSIKKMDQEEDRCKVCFMGEDMANPENILVTPCKCQGSIKYIHVQCLKEWITHKMTKVTYESNGNIKVKNKQCCQICKMKIPMCIKQNGKIIPLNNYIEGFQPYLAVHASTNGLYSTTQSESQQAFITFDETREVKIGRADDSGFSMAEQTVSRKHAELRIEDNKCYISDSQSKYGTLLYEQNAKVKLGKRLVGYQVLNTVYNFQIQLKY